MSSAALVPAVPAPARSRRGTVVVGAAVVGAALVVLAFGSLLVTSAEAQETPGLEEARARALILTQEINDAEVALSELESDIARAESARASLSLEFDELRDRVTIAAVDAFARTPGSQHPLSGDDLVSILRGQVLADAALGIDADAIENFRIVVEDLSVLDVELAEARTAQTAEFERLVGARADLEVELQNLEALERERLAEIARQQELARQRAAEKAEAAAAAAAAARAEAATNQPAVTDTTPRTSPSTSPTTAPDAEPTEASAPVNAAQAGGLLSYCPVQGAVSFIDSWGFPRSGGRRHKGVDMLASIGTPIVAPVSGVVSHRSNRVGGRSFHLDGNDGNYYFGTHLSAYGESGSVSAGTVIGYVGDDGNAAGIPHLHFEIHPDGSGAANPYPAVRDAC